MHVKQLQEFFDYKPYTGDPQFLVDDIIHQARRYLPADQIPLIQEAYEYSRDAHGDQVRLSGEIYITHPLKATIFLMDMKPDIATIQACILHDVIEDTPVTYEEIKEVFDEEVATLCEGLVKVSTVRYRGEERQLETIKKTFLAMAHDLRVIFIKIADRIHNIQTLRYHPNPEKRQRIAEETMFVYVSIAKRLGLYRYQLLLENGAFMILHPKDCEHIMSYLERSFGSGKTYINRGQQKIAAILRKNGIKYHFVKGRIKSPYSIFEKIERNDSIQGVSQVLDIVAFRVVTYNMSDCYNALGAVHSAYTPIIKKIKDYISIPKANSYQSLHTTVIAMFRFPVEIQIRTQKMDDVAEYGVAAHFVYSDRHAPKQISKSQASWIHRLQDIVTTYKTADNKEAFKKELSLQILSKSVFLYTPKGDIFEMPQGSTVLDFAFRIHTDVGLSFKSAIVNGVIKPIGYQPQSGDIIDIKRYRNKITATKYWFDFLRTSGAKSKLQRHVKKQESDEIMTRSLVTLNARLDEWRLPRIGSEGDLIRQLYKNDEREAHLIAMYYKQESYTYFFKEAYPEERSVFVSRDDKNQDIEKLSKISGGDAIVVDHHHHLAYRLCSTCHPSISDNVIAKSGRDGIVIHSVSCRGVLTANIASLIEAHRQGSDVAKYNITLEVEVDDPQKNLSTLLSKIADYRISVRNIQLDAFSSKSTCGAIRVVTYGANPAKFDLLRHVLKKHKAFHIVRIVSIA